MANKTNKPFEEFASFDQFFEHAENRVGYWEERAKLEFTREVVEQMEQNEVSKGELASRLEVRPGFVTRLLSGKNNFELATMVRLAMALDCRLRTHLQPEGASTIWCDVLNDASDEHLDDWNPYEFRSIERFCPPVEHENYETRTVAA